MSSNDWIQMERARIRAETYEAALNMLHRWPIELAIDRLQEKAREHRTIFEKIHQARQDKQ